MTKDSLTRWANRANILVAAGRSGTILRELKVMSRKSMNLCMRYFDEQHKPVFERFLAETGMVRASKSRTG